MNTSPKIDLSSIMKGKNTLENSEEKVVEEEKTEREEKQSK